MLPHWQNRGRSIPFGVYRRHSRSLSLWIYQNSPVCYLIDSIILSIWILEVITRQIPLTWTHTVAPYEPPLEDNCIYSEDPVSYNLSSLNQFFNVVFVNTPINYDCSNFRKLDIPRKVVPTGFVFVWADKENIPMILNIFEEKGFYYVENLVWVQEHDEDSTEMNEVFANNRHLWIEYNDLVTKKQENIVNLEEREEAA